MGINIAFRGGEVGDGDTDLGTNGGWSALARWLTALPLGEYPRLAILADAGQVENTWELADELDRALDREPGAPELAARLQKLLGAGDRHERVTIYS